MAELWYKSEHKTAKSTIHKDDKLLTTYRIRHCIRQVVACDKKIPVIKLHTLMTSLMDWPKSILRKLFLVGLTMEWRRWILMSFCASDFKIHMCKVSVTIVMYKTKQIIWNSLWVCFETIVYRKVVVKPCFTHPIWSRNGTSLRSLSNLLNPSQAQP